MNQCILCGRHLNEILSLNFILSFKAYRQSTICPRCKNKFERISYEHCCRDCSRSGDFKHRLCSDCQKWYQSTGCHFKNHALYRYNDMMSEYMHRYKFQGDYRLRKVFQKEFSQFINGRQRLVVPVPVHPNTYRQRGFNQVRGLLDNVKTIRALVTRTDKKVIPQSHKSKCDRMNLSQPFKLVDQLRDQIKGRDLLVVDDVYTTGTTIRHAAKVLKTAGAKSVIGVTLAR